MSDRRQSAINFEPTAARIRARARRMLAEAPIENPDLVWARRAALLAEIDGTPPSAIPRARRWVAGVWVWSK